jgi:hypothetical protein
MAAPNIIRCGFPSGGDGSRADSSVAGGAVADRRFIERNPQARGPEGSVNRANPCVQTSLERGDVAVLHTEVGAEEPAA